MMRSVSDKTSAADKSIGFEYQYYYFLDRVLNLKTGQVAGLEVEDDVHSTLNVDLNIFFQLKHTVQTNTAGTPVALTELDEALWKTLFNWAQVICDPVKNRSTIKEQITFVQKSEFHLVTNKSKSPTNYFLDSILSFQAGDLDIDGLLNHLRQLETKTKDAKIKEYIGTVLKLNVDVLSSFVKRIRFELELVDVIEKAKRSLREKVIDDDKVDPVFDRLDSNIRQDNFIAIKRGEKILISFENFINRYKKIFEDGRTKKLMYPKFVPVLPNDIFAQKFIQQLMEIGDITIDDKELAIDYTKYKLQITTYLNDWQQSGDIVGDEIDRFHDEAFVRWRNEFRNAFKRCNTSKEVIDAAISLLTSLRKERFKLGESDLDTSLCNGELYHLSDVGKIGWHKDWESK